MKDLSLPPFLSIALHLPGTLGSRLFLILCDGPGMIDTLENPLSPPEKARMLPGRLLLGFNFGRFHH